MTSAGIPQTRSFRLFWRLLSRWLGPEHRSVVLSELDELYQIRRERLPGSLQRSWIWRQLLRYPIYLIWEHYRQSDNPTITAVVENERQKEPMRTLSQDFRHSFRSLLKTPVVTCVVILTVGLAIGANTAIYALIQGVLLNPLSYPQSDRLVRIVTQPSPERRWPLSVVDYQALSKEQTVFSQVAGFANSVMTFNREEIAERIRGRFVTWSYFPLLGISPLHGRLFSETDDRPEAAATVVVSHSFWERYLEGRPDVVGQSIRLDGVPYQLIGILPQQRGSRGEPRFLRRCPLVQALPKGTILRPGIGTDPTRLEL